MDKEYTFEMMWEDLNNGYEIHYTYVRNKYLLFKCIFFVHFLSPLFLSFILLDFQILLQK